MIQLFCLGKGKIADIFLPSIDQISFWMFSQIGKNQYPNSCNKGLGIGDFGEAADLLSNCSLSELSQDSSICSYLARQ